MVSDSVFIDTSGFYALMDRSDKNFERAKNIWESLLEKETTLYTSNYVVVETTALLQSRLGFEAAELWMRDLLSVTDVVWIDKDMHHLAYQLWLGFGRRKLSFVDCVSFAVMRHYKVDKVFGFDQDFISHGFVFWKQ